ncbi:MAG TPA: hypothetical protein VI911_08830 [Patescibacteria group bacterium]|nr:MAG: Capsid decoration protein [candidate division TM6 bacterium GW2011_GWF2_33_332]HLD91101.1 hypothetical protein [Patescibacteria group bacterium]
MTDISKLIRYIDGFHKEVDLNGGTDILKVSSIKVGANSAEITGAIADKLILIASVVDGSSGADQVGLTAVRTQVTVQSGIEKLDTDLGTAETAIGDLVILSGVAVNAENLGEFTGSTIVDNSTVKAALQALETAHEEVDVNANDLITLSGVAENAQHLGAFTGSTIADSSTIKVALQAIESAHETTAGVASGAADDVGHLVTLSGVAVDSDNLGSFTGSTIADDQTIKAALQALETAQEEIDANANDLVTLSGVAENAQHLGTFTGSVIADSSTIKAALQALETEVESIPSPLFYAGTYNATTNSPDLDLEAARVQGALYRVTTAGTHDFGAFGGSIVLASGDKVAYNGSAWEKWDVSDEVTSVNGQAGDVVLEANDIGLSDAYAASAGVIANTDTIESAIAKLDARSSVQSVSITLTNNTGSAIPAGSVVCLSQTVAGEIILADADALSTCEGTIGVVIAEIADEASGLVQVAGEVTVLKDGNFDLGKRVYLSATAGNATKTAPADKNIVLLGHASALGKIVLAPHLELAI